MIPTLSALDARRLLLSAQGLLDDPRRPANVRELGRLIERLGFVQMDSINVVERAHHLTLWSRLERFRRDDLVTLLEKDRALFEHWTHDASVFPSRWYVHWKPRFERDRKRLLSQEWWASRLGGSPAPLLARIKEQIAREGPQRSADFEHEEGKRGAWWGWTPTKAALETLWRVGELAVSGRVHFHKTYDLAERVFPEQHVAKAPGAREHRDWACTTAAERLLIFTARELASFWRAIDVKEAAKFCAEETLAGRLTPIAVESADGRPPVASFAVADWEARLQQLPEAPAAMRLLCPFDPVLRDRDRCLRRFGFDYRFEAFVPQQKRRFGYFVLPLLEGDRLVGRLDPKLHREERRLEIKGLFWEEKVKPTAARRRATKDAVERLATFLGATTIDGLPGP